jgi:predicted O-methyltransferase YrrM
MQPDVDQAIIVNQIVRPDGEKVNVPLLGERFKYSGISKDDIMPTMKFQIMNGWQILEKLVPIILYFNTNCIVEIGAGSSTIYLARVAEEFGVKLYSCDKSPRKNNVYFKDHIFEQVMSENFMKTFDDTPAVVLIDADHSYEAAKKEFDFFIEKLVVGGVIFLHDTMPPAEEYLTETACGDVYLLRQELEQRQDIDCFTWPYTAGFMGLTMCIKKDPEARYWER